MGNDQYKPFPEISAWAAVPFDSTTYDQYAALLDEARAEATEEAREHAVRTAIRYAGTDTGALEGLYTTDRGFTRTVAIEAASWEAAANERGPNAATIIKDQIDAYEWLLDLVTQSRPVTEHVVRELHAMLCRSQDTYTVHTEVGRQERPLPKGEYKRFPNNPTSLATGQVHYYAPPDMVAAEMHRLVASLSEGPYLSVHPVVQSAYLHYALAAIHPFPDGNGRVARALSSVPLYRHARVPPLVFRDQRDEYLDTLEAADAGDLVPFTRFVGQRSVEAMDLVILTTKAGPADRSGSLAALRELVSVERPLRRSELETLANGVEEEIRRALREQFDASTWPATITVSSSIDVLEHADLQLPPGYAWPRNRGSRRYELSHASPGDPATTFGYNVAVSTSSAGPPLLALTTLDSPPPLEVSIEEADPQPKELLKIKIAHWAQRLLDAALADLARRAQGAAHPSSPN